MKRTIKWRNGWRWLVAALTVATVCAQPAAAGQSPESATSRSSISGVVTRDGEPAAGVGVVACLVRDNRTYAGKDALRTVTGKNGRFEFSGLPKGTYVIDAHMPGASVRTDTPWDGAVRILVGEGESVDNVAVALETGGVITGRLTDATGKPICGESILLFVLRRDGAFEQIGTHASSMGTDDRGIYRIYGLSGGSYAVGAGTDAGEVTYRGEWMPYIERTYYGGATKLSDAKLVEVGPGTEAGNIDIVARRGRAGIAVEGRVVDAASRKPLAGVTVGIGPMVNGEMLGLTTSKITAGDGSFRIQGVRAGVHGLVPLTVGTELNAYFAPVQEIAVGDQSLANIEIELRRGATVTGVVVAEKSESRDPIPLGGSRILTLEPVRRDGVLPPDFEWHGRELSVLSDGSFRAEGVPPGEFRIVARPDASLQGAYVAQVLVDGVETRQPIRTVGGETIDNVRVVIGFGRAVIRGKLEFVGRSVAPFRISINLGRAGEGVAIRTASVDDAGTFVFEGVPSGEFVVTAVAVVESGLRRRSEPVSVSTGGQGVSFVKVEIDLRSDRGDRKEPK